MSTLKKKIDKLRFHWISQMMTLDWSTLVFQKEEFSMEKELLSGRTEVTTPEVGTMDPEVGLV